MMWRAKWIHVVIALGVIAALAIASPVFGVSVKKLVKKEVAKQIAKATGPVGPPGTNGTNGTNGTDGTARAYARVVSHVSDDCTGGCTLDHSKGISSVNRLNAGEYCVRAPGIDANSVSAAVTVEYGTTSAPKGNASAMTSFSSCAPDGFRVLTERQSSTTVCTNDTCTTMASVAGNAAAADNVGFTIVIP